MNQCVPSWELDDPNYPAPPRLTDRSGANSFFADVPTLDYEVAELTWENGQLAMHGLGPPRLISKPEAAANIRQSKYAWDKPCVGGTLESIVNQATRADGGGKGHVPWFNPHRFAAAPDSFSASATAGIDALVPCSHGGNRGDRQEPSPRVRDGEGTGTRVVGSSNGERSSGGSGAASGGSGSAPEWSGVADRSISGSATFWRESQQITVDTCEKGLSVEVYTSTSMGSPGNTSSANHCTKGTASADNEHDSVCHSRSQRETGDGEDKKRANGKSSVSTKRSRAAAIHNQSERKRRDKINQKMKTLQKLVPNSSKTDKASMLDEVIEYLKQLQAQVNMMSRINLSPMMLPMAMHQQLQMSLMTAPLGIGMGAMGLGVMDMNSIGRTNLAGIPPILPPAAFMPVAPWDGFIDRLPSSTSAMPDPFSSFLAGQSQPITMDAFNRMAALYQQQFQQPPPPASRN